MTNCMYSTRMIQFLPIVVLVVSWMASCFDLPLVVTAFAFNNVLQKNYRYSALSSQWNNNNNGISSFSDRLVDCLDLVPLLEEVSRHCATKRGRQAILRLVNVLVDNSPLNRQQSKRQSLLAESVSYPNNLKVSAETNKPIVVSIAQTVVEANAEYELIREAMSILQTNDKTIFPPIYGGTSPFDTSIVDTDDDDWLSGGELDLQSILQADKVCSRLIMMKEWSTSNTTIALAPNAAKICHTINVDPLQMVLDEIGGTVQIVRGGKRGTTQSFSFQWDATKFPALRLLRRKEQNLLAKLETSGNLEQENQIAQIQEEIAAVENQIFNHQQSVIAQAAPHIDAAMNRMARVDTLFARAAFGCSLNGAIPVVRNEGIIDVKEFVNPVLATRTTSEGVVPINLQLAAEHQQALIISGPNGGGKTVALKSFGVAATLIKVGVPIFSHDSAPPRIDFFHDVLVEVGDNQNIDGGESTLMARLNSCSQILQGFATNESIETRRNYYPLILLDELGGGTDPEAGSAIARAILEELLHISPARIVATTHSPQLKAMSINDEKFRCAAVLLERTSNSDFQRPAFRLQYDIIGDSHALGAASRCSPSLPQSVLERATELMAGGEDPGNLWNARMTSLEREQGAAEEAKRQAESTNEELLQCRRAMESLSQAHQDQLSRLEARLNHMFTDLKQDETRSAYDLMGDTLGELRLVKKKIATIQELLAEKGLRVPPVDYEFQEGQSVVIIAEGEFNGQTATVQEVKRQSCGGIVDEVTVIPSYGFVDWGFEEDVETPPRVLKLTDIAIWDYPNDLNTWEFGEEQSSYSKRKRIPDAKQNLVDTLQNLSSFAKAGNGHGKPSSSSSNPKFKSSRERKAASSGKAKKRDSKEKSRKRRR
mmetsp:Transcript_13628/g.20751  ORF Transcript_13628/g.20751 Transcript_13628/m.20751 type:complete len:883 (+) Transcript_13628:121-2769(+)